MCKERSVKVVRRFVGHIVHHNYMAFKTREKFSKSIRRYHPNLRLGPI